MKVDCRPRSLSATRSIGSPPAISCAASRMRNRVSRWKPGRGVYCKVNSKELLSILRIAAAEGNRLKFSVKFNVSPGPRRHGSTGSALFKVARTPSGVLRTMSAVPTGMSAVCRIGDAADDDELRLIGRVVSLRDLHARLRARIGRGRRPEQAARPRWLVL